MRNPYDRCLSRFYYSKKVYEDRGSEKAWDLEDIDQYMRYNPWFINENWAMYTQADEVLVDFFVRYEHLEADLAAVSARLGFERNVYDDMKAISAKKGIRPKAAAPPPGSARRAGRWSGSSAPRRSRCSATPPTATPRTGRAPAACG